MVLIEKLLKKFLGRTAGLNLNELQHFLVKCGWIIVIRKCHTKDNWRNWCRNSCKSSWKNHWMKFFENSGTSLSKFSWKNFSRNLWKISYVIIGVIHERFSHKTSGGITENYFYLNPCGFSVPNSEVIPLSTPWNTTGRLPWRIVKGIWRRISGGISEWAPESMQ